jgi:hypothetical protein
LLNLRSLFLPLLLLNALLRLPLLLNFRPPFILLLSLLSQFLSLLLWARLIALDTPGSSLFPMPIIFPTLPVLLKPLVRNPFIVPSVSVPVTVSVVSSPTRIHVKIETWNGAIITPAPVIIMRAIPTTMPLTPPPALVEEDIVVYVRNNIDIRIRQHYQRRR